MRTVRLLLVVFAAGTENIKNNEEKRTVCIYVCVFLRYNTNVFYCRPNRNGLKNPAA